MGGWLYITPEQGAIIESICDQFWDGCKGDGCQRCPLLPACDDVTISVMEEPERTRVFEQRMWELAKEATK